MKKKLLVTLLRNNIQELNMITDSFMEMNEYPTAIIHLAKRKTEDIQTIIDQLANAKDETPAVETPMMEEQPAAKHETVVVEHETEAPAPIKAETPVEVAEQKTEIIEETEDITIIETEDEKEIIVETTEVKEITEVKDDHEIKVTSSETKKTTIADKIVQPTISRNDSMVSKEDNSISASLANKKIADIKEAINIGDRFRFQRELFNGNGEDMNKTLSYINQLATLDEIVSFLQTKYNWDEQNEIAADLYQIIKRKFV